MKIASLIATFLTLVGTPLVSAQIEADSQTGIRFGSQKTQRWQVGLHVAAPPRGACGGIFGTVPVPTEWPEQEVRIVEEDIASQARVRYRMLDSGVKQMMVGIPLLRAGEKASVLVTFEVTTREILPPENPDEFVLPERVPRKMGLFLGSSPYIEVRHREIRSLARKLAKEQQGAWETVEAMYDWVRENVEYKNGKLKGALAALRDGEGDCEELTSLFIALCRANRIPARTVWVPGHCYPEFYLEDQEGNGHWIPCQIAGTRNFGGMPDHKPILQKGDNFRVPEKKEPQRYVAELLKVKAVRGSGNPSVQFVRELLPAL